jgi:hypothetical protein
MNGCISFGLLIRAYIGLLDQERCEKCRVLGRPYPSRPSQELGDATRCSSGYEPPHAVANGLASVKNCRVSQLAND